MKYKALLICAAVFVLAASTRIVGQLVDRNKAPNVANEGIARPLTGPALDGGPSQIGDGRNGTNPNTSLNVIAFDPFRAIRRGRQLFQRKFSVDINTGDDGFGPGLGNSRGDINTVREIGAGVVDSCAGCHGRPRGSAGFGGDVVTRPDSRDAPHLFGLGLKEMLADEITAELRAIRASAISQARRERRSITRTLVGKGIRYGSIRARSDGSVDTSGVQGVDRDLRVRPFFHHGGTISIREFVVGALRAEMGLLMTGDPDLVAAQNGQRVVTPSGMVLDGRTDPLLGRFDSIEVPPAVEEGDIGGNVQHRAALVDFLEFYLLNYFKPGTGQQTSTVNFGRQAFTEVGCATCHIPNLTIQRDRRVADVETVYNPTLGRMNRLFATATPLLANPESIGQANVRKIPAGRSFVVRNIFTDFKRHDLGPDFHEREYDGTLRTQMMTTPLWGVGSTPSYGHDGRSINLMEVILRHGGEAQASRNAFASRSSSTRDAIIAFLNSLILFPPDDTASNLPDGGGDRDLHPQLPLGHGSIRLTGLFNNPAIIE
jgi:Di-haem oxidoreductase, putative peroxidase